MYLTDMSWLVPPPSKWADGVDDTLPKFISPLDELESDSATSLSFDTDSGGGSSRKSSLARGTDLMDLPSATFDDYYELETTHNGSLNDEKSTPILQTQTSAFSIGTKDNASFREKPDFYQSRRLAFKRSHASQTIVIRLSYFDNGRNCDKAPDTVIMNDTQNFQVLLGSLAGSLRLLPESLGFWILVKSKEIKLSPIVSPRELGFSGELAINVRIGSRLESASKGSDLCVGNRIAGTNWVRSFPTRVYKSGLPKNPSQSRTIITATLD